MTWDEDQQEGWYTGAEWSEGKWDDRKWDLNGSMAKLINLIQVKNTVKFM